MRDSNFRHPFLPTLDKMEPFVVKWKEGILLLFLFPILNLLISTWIILQVIIQNFELKI